jgi:plasmid stability protein
VKQLLLRVPEDLHRRLVARAAREGRSLNAVATEILDAAAAGTLRRVNARPVSADRRRRIIESTRGLGPRIEQLLAHERERP